MDCKSIVYDLIGSNPILPTKLFYIFIYIIMAYIKRPTTQSAEYFRPDVYVNFRSTNSINEQTQEIKKGWVFVIWKKNNETWEYESKEVDSLEFFSLIILDKLESEYESSDLVKNIYTEELSIKDKKSFKFVCNAKWDNDLKKFIDVKTRDVLEDFKVKKVLIGQLKDTKEIFKLELWGTQARNLMTRKFSRNNLYNANWDYKLTPEEEDKQKQVVTLFMNWVDLKLIPSKEAYKVWKDKNYKNVYLLEVEWNTNEVKLDEKALKTIDILEAQLSWNNKPTAVSQPESNEEISIEDVPF